MNHKIKMLLFGMTPFIPSLLIWYPSVFLQSLGYVEGAAIYFNIASMIAAFFFVIWAYLGYYMAMKARDDVSITVKETLIFAHIPALLFLVIAIMTLGREMPSSIFFYLGIISLPEFILDLVSRIFPFKVSMILTMATTFIIMLFSFFIGTKIEEYKHLPRYEE